jgi:hypothetical protein
MMDKRSSVQTVKSVAKTLLQGETPQDRTQAMIREKVSLALVLDPFHRDNISDVEKEKVIREIEAELGVRMGDGFILEKEGSWTEWLTEAKRTIDPYYWGRYAEFLEQEDVPEVAIVTTDRDTDNILGRLGNPHDDKKAWDRRGLVLGHVQSGKTLNYIGLVNKAADAGYKVIIVLAGMQDNLRKQTQGRIDEGFIGRDTGKKKGEERVGVGNINLEKRPNYGTTKVGDFSLKVVQQFGVQIKDLPEPLILVIKKNGRILQNLLDWLELQTDNGQELDQTLLLIDDEADNASINTNDEDKDPTKINGQLRQLLAKFARRSYVGYTATPFANVFINPEARTEIDGADLFPRDFIYGINPPSNYMGPDQLFMDPEENSAIVDIPDSDNWLPVKHRKDADVNGLSESLKEAIRTFVLAKAIRIIRGDDRKHCSMLVNASRFNDVQLQIFTHISVYLTKLKNATRYQYQNPMSEALKDSHIKDLFSTWERQYGDLDTPWSEIQAQLKDAASPIEVVEVNQRNKGKLDYDAFESGYTVIAVGGLALSRGLTLEGLVVSYYLRNSYAADTVLQMGRWFGYRVGYEDLCRIWMWPDSIDWYTRVAESVRELRADLKTMAQESALGPRDFGVKVLAHEDIPLILTARKKIGYARKERVMDDLGGTFPETAFLSPKNEDISSNLEAVACLIADSNKVGMRRSSDDGIKVSSSHYFWSGVPQAVITKFLKKYRNVPNNRRANVESIIKHISESAEDYPPDYFAEWDVCLVSRKREEKDKLSQTVGGLTIHCADRYTVEEPPFNHHKAIQVNGYKLRLGEKTDLKMGLSPAEINDEEARYSNKHKSEKKGMFLFKGRKPALIVRLVRMGIRGEVDKEKVFTKEIPFSGKRTALVGWTALIPLSGKKSRLREYMVNLDWTELYSKDFSEIDDDELED